jgi:hypothetical protein
MLAVCNPMAATLPPQKRVTWRGMPLCRRVASWCRLARRPTCNRPRRLSNNRTRPSRCVVRTKHPSTHISIISRGWTSRQWCNSNRREMRGHRLQRHPCATRPASSVSNTAQGTRSFLRGPCLQLLIHRSQCDLPQGEVPTGRSPGLTTQIIPRRRASHTRAPTWSDPTRRSLSR